MQNKLNKICVVVLLMFVYIPCTLIGAELGKGNLIVVVNAEDGVTPIEGAVLKLRNVSTQDEIQSEPSDELGEISVQGLDVGLYIAGIIKENTNFNIGYLIGIKADKTAKLPIALDFDADVGEKDQPARDQNRKGFFSSLFANAGFASVLAASAGALVAFTVINENEKEVSEFR